MNHPLVWKSILWAGVVACLYVTETAADQAESMYRKGTPAVLKPAAEKTLQSAEVPSLAVRDAFRRFYRQQGSPRLAVFWNRVLNDQLREMETESRVVFTRTTASRADDASSVKTSEDQLSVGVETRTKNVRMSPLSEASGMRFQTGYLRPFIEEGAQMIDRNMILRLTGASQAIRDPSRPVRDQQLIEMLSLKGHADLLVQITLTPSEESRFGAFFQVSVIEIKSGRIRASFVNDATFKNETKKWKAIRGGFVEVESTDSPKIDLERMGRILASQTMVVLSRT